MNTNARFSLSRRTVVLAVSALVLTWLVVTRSFAAYLADAAPQAALWIDSGQPEALVNIADGAIESAATSQLGTVSPARNPQQPEATSDGARRASNVAVTSSRAFDRAFSDFESIGQNQSISRPVLPANATTVRTWAETALKSEPLSAHAFRVLGQIADADRNDAAAYKFMHAASRLSLHDEFASYWLLRASARSNDYKSAIYYADVLLRTDPQSSRFVAPVLAGIIQNKDGAALVEKVLARNPPWRTEFIATLPNDVTDVRTPLTLLLALRQDPTPPKTADIVPYLNFLIAHKFYGLAYYTWLQFLSPNELRHVGFLFNGNFDGALSGAPFDWNITQGTGVMIDVAPRPDKADQHVLMVDFEFGRVDYHSVTELVMLAPGTYQFHGQYQGNLLGPRGLKWRVVCANGKSTSGGESPMITGVTQGWKNVAFTFTVPPQDCTAQYVRLDLDARMASEELVSGTILFDDLQISRVANPSPAGG